MFCLNKYNIYHLYSQGIDMRKGVEVLCGIIRTYQYSPTNQEVYVFANKSRTLVKMLHWERGGFVVYYKRLEQGRLSPSIFHHKNATAFIDIRWDESGEDLAVISTLIQTCELLGINPKDWLSKTFSKIAGQNNYNPEPLQPYHYEENK